MGKNTVAKVTPLLFDGLTPTDIQGPLSQFQAAVFSKKEIKKLIHSLNKSLGSSALDGGMLDESIDIWWPKLEEEIAAIPTDNFTDDEFYQRDERSLLKEALQLVRALYYRDERYELVEPILLRPIDDLEFSESCEKALKKQSIIYVGDLVSLTEIDLLKAPGITKRMLTEVRDILASRSLSLGLDLENWPPKTLSTF